MDGWNNLVTFTEEILNEKLHFLCSVNDTYVVNLLLFDHETFNDKKRHAKLFFTVKSLKSLKNLLEISYKFTLFLIPS